MEPVVLPADSFASRAPTISTVQEGTQTTVVPGSAESIPLQDVAEMQTNEVEHQLAMGKAATHTSESGVLIAAPTSSVHAVTSKTSSFTVTVPVTVNAPQGVGVQSVTTQATVTVPVS